MKKQEKNLGGIKTRELDKKQQNPIVFNLLRTASVICEKIFSFIFMILYSILILLLSICVIPISCFLYIIWFLLFPFELILFMLSGYSWIIDWFKKIPKLFRTIHDLIDGFSL